MIVYMQVNVPWGLYKIEIQLHVGKCYDSGSRNRKFVVINSRNRISWISLMSLIALDDLVSAIVS